jgi:hypothetical protein
MLTAMSCAATSHRLAVLLLCPLVLVGCDEFPANSQVGVSGSPAGEELQIHVAGCEAAEFAATITVYQVVGQVGADEDDEVLWSIELAEASAVRAADSMQTFTFGEVPRGYRELVSPSPLPSGAVMLGVQLHLGSVFPYIGFGLEELRSEGILSRDTYYSTEQFVSQAREVCP